MCLSWSKPLPIRSTELYFLEAADPISESSLPLDLLNSLSGSYVYSGKKGTSESG